MDAKEAVAALNISCEKIRKLTEAVTTTQSAKAPQSVSNPQASTAPPAAKKRKVSKYAVLLDNPTALVRKRVAKYFGMRKIQTLYFGTVTEYSADNKWWHILYDDEDSEDIGHKELYDALSLYEEHKNEDPNV